MQCLFCKENIDDDSFYCDMCGEEIKVCEVCKKVGKGKMCTVCGKPLLTLHLQNTGAAPGGETSDIKPPPLSGGGPPKPEGLANQTYRLPDNQVSHAAMPKLSLHNKSIAVDLEIDDNSILGRTMGPYIAIFGKYNQVSSQHCRFNYDHGKGWNVTDLGSTNKTQYNNQEIFPNKPQFLTNQNHLKIANIEFFIKIVPC